MRRHVRHVKSFLTLFLSQIRSSPAAIVIMIVLTKRKRNHTAGSFMVHLRVHAPLDVLRCYFLTRPIRRGLYDMFTVVFLIAIYLLLLG